jgi:hypothetical protein
VADAHAAVIFELRAISVIGAVVNRDDCITHRLAVTRNSSLSRRKVRVVETRFAE